MRAATSDSAETRLFSVSVSSRLVLRDETETETVYFVPRPRRDLIDRDRDEAYDSESRLVSFHPHQTINKNKALVAEHKSSRRGGGQECPLNARIPIDWRLATPLPDPEMITLQRSSHASCK